MESEKGIKLLAARPTEWFQEDTFMQYIPNVYLYNKPTYG